MKVTELKRTLPPVHPFRTVRDVLGFTWYVLVRFYEDNALQAASALTYTVLLAVVPLTTITIAIFSAFPAFGALEATAREFILSNLVPQVGATVADNLSAFAANAGSLTMLGVLGLIVTSILMLATIEGAFNAIWRVRESRSLLVRVLTFWSVLTLTPLLFAAGLSLGNTLVPDTIGRNIVVWSTLSVVLPILFQSAAFGLLYWIVPNRPVRWTDAAIGGLVAGLLFELAKYLFALYLQAFPMYQTVYGALAAIPIFLLWLYLVWALVLFGAVITAALPDWRSGKLIGGGLENLMSGPKLTLACAILKELTLAGRLGVALSRDALVRRVGIGASGMDQMLAMLRRARFVDRTMDDAWVMTRDASVATVRDLLHDLNIGIRGPVGSVAAIDGPWLRRLQGMVERAERAWDETLSLPLAELFREPEPAESPKPGLSGVTPLRLQEQRGKTPESRP